MHVIFVKHQTNFILTCTFRNGAQCEVDLTHVTQWEDQRALQLQDSAIFSKVIAFRGRLLWPNLFSLCPAYIESISQRRLNTSTNSLVNRIQFS
jgi:hypothetical protein